MAGAHEQWLRDHRDYPHDYCLIWPFARNAEYGRGIAGIVGKSPHAHRVMCEMVHGPAPSTKHQAAHSCGNGHLGCVNPRHLKWATNSENQIERYRVHGRSNPNPTGNKGRFTPEQIARMRSQHGEFTQLKLAEMYGCSLGTVQYYLKYRDQRGHAGQKIRHWHPDEESALRESVAAGLNFKQAAERLGRSFGAVVSKAGKIGLRSPYNRKVAP
jgi:hypothetical protein